MSGGATGNGMEVSHMPVWLPPSQEGDGFVGSGALAPTLNPGLLRVTNTQKLPLAPLKIIDAVQVDREMMHTEVRARRMVRKCTGGGG